MSFFDAARKGGSFFLDVSLVFSLPIFRHVYFSFIVLTLFFNTITGFFTSIPVSEIQENWGFFSTVYNMCPVLNIRLIVWMLSWLIDNWFFHRSISRFIDWLFGPLIDRFIEFTHCQRLFPLSVLILITLIFFLSFSLYSRKPYWAHVYHQPTPGILGNANCHVPTWKPTPRYPAQNAPPSATAMPFTLPFPLQTTPGSRLWRRKTPGSAWKYVLAFFRGRFRSDQPGARSGHGQCAVWLGAIHGDRTGRRGAVGCGGIGEKDTGTGGAEDESESGVQDFTGCGEGEEMFRDGVEDWTAAFASRQSTK